MDNFKKEIGSRIRRKRREKGLTLKEISQITGITNSALSKIERGAVSVSAENLFLISQVLDISNDYILSGKEFKESSFSNVLTEIHEENLEHEEAKLESIELTLEEEEMIRILRELDELDQIEIATITRMKRDLRKSINSLQKEQSAQADSKQDTTRESKKSST